VVFCDTNYLTNWTATYGQCDRCWQLQAGQSTTGHLKRFSILLFLDGIQIYVTYQHKDTSPHFIDASY